MQWQSPMCDMSEEVDAVRVYRGANGWGEEGSKH